MAQHADALRQPAHDLRSLESVVDERRLGESLHGFQEAGATPSAARAGGLDSTLVKVHKHGAGAPKKNGKQIFSRSRHGMTTKVHAMSEPTHGGVLDAVGG